MTISFTVLGKPQPRGSKRAFMRPGMRFPVITDDNPKGKPWMQAIAATAKDAMNSEGLDLLDCPICLRVKFKFCRPKGHMGKKGLRPSAPVHHTVKPDATKLLRGLEDALTGILWRDDSQVVSQTVSKEYGEFDHTEVTVTGLPEIPATTV